MNSQPSASDRGLFIRNFFTNFFEMGAVLPSSRFLGQAGVAYLAQKQGPVQILEVGSGTGSFTQEIVPLLEPGDSLDMVEINSDLIRYLKRRFEQEAAFQTQPGVTLNFVNADARMLGPRLYDFIVFSLPLTNFPSEMVEEILTAMVARLKPGGVFSYVKYAFIWRFKYWFGGGNTRQAMTESQQIIQTFAKRYQIKQRLVVINVPPTWVYYWQNSED